MAVFLVAAAMMRMAAREGKHLAHSRAGVFDMSQIQPLVTVMLLLSAGLVPARASTADSWFQTTTQALFDAVATGDKAVWDRVLDADAIITTEDGEVQSRKQFLDSLQALPPGFRGAIKLRGLTVRHLGDAAVAHYWLDEWEDIFGQKLFTVYVETDTYRRAGAGWKLTAAQVTVVPRDLEHVTADSTLWPSLVGEYRLSEKTSARYRVFVRNAKLWGGKDAASATELIPLREIHKYNEVRIQRVGRGER